MPGKRASITKTLASTVDTGEAERLLTTAMATSEILSGYTKDEVALIADNMSIVNFESAQDVMLEGEPGSWVGVILSGTMVVVIKNTEIMSLSTGAIVGEVALWSPDSKRTATMRGKDAGVVAMLLVSELAAFVTAHGRVGLKLMRQFGTAALHKMTSHNSMKMEATLQPLLEFNAPPDNVQQEIDAWVAILIAQVVASAQPSAPNPHPNPQPNPHPNPQPNPHPNLTRNSPRPRLNPQSNLIRRAPHDRRSRPSPIPGRAC